MPPPKSNDTPPSQSNSTTSYTAMAVGDVEAIGAHCQMEYCHQLDFLPFRCESCHGKFCLDHRSETAHKCSKEGAWARERAARNNPQSTSMVSSAMLSVRPNILNHEKQCSSPQCKTLIDTALVPGVQCDRCNRRYCLKHRMKEDHACETLTPVGARPAKFADQQRERGKTALEKLKAWGMTKRAAIPSTNTLLNKTSTKRATAAANLAAVNSLKTTAKGDAKIAPDKRIYLFVEASADTTKAKFPTGKFFYAKDWTIGRLLDAAAKSLQVENVNNRGGGEAEKLRVFHVESGRLLEFSEKVGDVLQTGNTVVLLRGVGGAPPSLMEM